MNCYTCRTDKKVHLRDNGLRQCDNCYQRGLPADRKTEKRPSTIPAPSWDDMKVEVGGVAIGPPLASDGIDLVLGTNGKLQFVERNDQNRLSGPWFDRPGSAAAAIEAQMVKEAEQVGIDPTTPAVAGMFRCCAEIMAAQWREVEKTISRAGATWEDVEPHFHGKWQGNLEKTVPSVLAPAATIKADCSVVIHDAPRTIPVLVLYPWADVFKTIDDMPDGVKYCEAWFPDSYNTVTLRRELYVDGVANTTFFCATSDLARAARLLQMRAGARVVHE